MAETETETGIERSGIIHHPFSESIMLSAFPERFKLPAMEKYDGLADAEEHLAVFNAHMLFYADIANDALKCRAFPTTLTKFAIRWFFSLPPNSVNSFSDLSAKFLERHALTIAVRKSTNAIRDFPPQGLNESLRDYINRFNRVAMEVKIDKYSETILPIVAINAIRRGVYPGPFADSLIMRPPQSLHDLRRIASFHINWEEEEKGEEEEAEQMTTRPYWGRGRGRHRHR